MYASSPVTASTAPIAARDEPEATAIGTPAACRRSTKTRICGKTSVDVPASSRYRAFFPASSSSTGASIPYSARRTVSVSRVPMPMNRVWASQSKSRTP